MKETASHDPLGKSIDTGLFAPKPKSGSTKHDFFGLEARAFHFDALLNAHFDALLKAHFDTLPNTSRGSTLVVVVKHYPSAS